MRHGTIAVVLALTAVISLCISPRAVTAQSDRASRLTVSTAREATNIRGVEIFADRPQEFNPLAASDRELASYGLPVRPDSAVDPKAAKIWERAMSALKYRPSPYLEAKPYFHREMMRSNRESRESAANGAYGSFNWSGVAVTNTLTAWNTTTSFNEVRSVFNVPAAQPPFGACAKGITGPFYESSWNGIDGFSNGDVLQGGSTSYADCSGHTLQTATYYGWVEWYPSYASLELFCGATPCPVHPGDDFYVITMGSAGCDEQYVFVEDVTAQWGGTYGLTWVTGPCLVGSSAEWIVERPAVSTGLTALANTFFEFFDPSYATDVAGKIFPPGSQVLSPAVITMLADDGKTTIESVESGNTGYQGMYSLWFQDESCAYSGGCTP